MFIPFVVNAATDVITNTKLHKAIMDYDGIFIDTNSDGVLSSSEVANYNGNLNLSNKNLTSSDINELSKFKNLTHLSLDFNNITDLSSILGLSKLSYLSLSGNPYNCSFINGFDKCNQLYELKSMIESNSGNIATLGLKINFDTSKITASTPKYKVLVTIVKDINTDVTFLNGGTGHVEYHMNDLDITLIKEYMRLYEMYVEKLSNYKVDLLVLYY